MSFIPDPFSRETYKESWQVHMRTQDYVNQTIQAIQKAGDLTATVIEIQSREVQETIKASSRIATENAQNIASKTSDAICETIQYAFSEFNSSVLDVNTKIENLSQLVGEGFSEMAEQLRVTNFLLGKITSVVRIPDIQKERVHYVEEGLKYLINAIRNGKDDPFYIEAAEEFQKALAIEKKDFYALYYLGYIHLYSSIACNAEAAEEEFRNAGRYFLAEAAVDETTFSKNMLPHAVKYERMAAQAFYHASVACYHLANIGEAIVLAQRAWNSDPNFSKAGFMLSISLAADRQVQEAASSLEKAILQNPIYYRSAEAEPVLYSLPEIRSLLKRLQMQVCNEVMQILNNYAGYICAGSIARDYLCSIEELTDAGDFLRAIKAKDMLYAKNNWHTIQGAHFNTDGSIVPSISSTHFQGSILDLIVYENKAYLAIPVFHDLHNLEDNKRVIRTVDLKISSCDDKIKARRKEIRSFITLYAQFLGILLMVYVLKQWTENPEYILTGLLNKVILPLLLGLGFIVAIIATAVIAITFIWYRTKIINGTNELKSLNRRRTDTSLDTALREKRITEQMKRIQEFRIHPLNS